MPEVYIHLSGGDIEKKMLEKAGFVTDDEEPRVVALEPQECPRCKTMNTYDALYCQACSMALTEHAAYQVEEKTGRGGEERRIPEFVGAVEARPLSESAALDPPGPHFFSLPPPAEITFTSRSIK